MTYEVIKYFTDLQDNDYEYNVGDIFPRDGLRVTDERLKELSTDENRQQIPLIKPISEAQDFSSMKVSELKEVAKKQGIEGYSDMKKAELIDELKGDT
ncbi:Rho termination factor N-terminal domain-containing protein [Staphylococcus saprophyticus]|uniref:Rho termination factor N-terminal domain-containing protein n=1 Tax=Staphylococcus saprophyticus TaxID=29385 RepID=UPI00076B27B2|nr:Rho termination factor N-terminal domain-containing protein [Staphylococcus saprophyticus]AMG20709.1 Rho termination protein [Staphylococcus saprophyticus]MDW3861849.1 Rho termination factor N-terminal domain-containing protein [Staphylococcus saprophyticus]MDW3914113.1 Rho termination factor N-terminal domain-containing protein [Staphylococcus saprophyticus]MDW3924142.1 Rho termination factor N-terminal domain-containing protein [Staphylococcus saprophyticus]MDW3939119.1 Rho termination fa